MRIKPIPLAMFGAFFVLLWGLGSSTRLGGVILTFGILFLVAAGFLHYAKTPPIIVSRAVPVTLLVSLGVMIGLAQILVGEFFPSLWLFYGFIFLIFLAFTRRHNSTVQQ